MAIGSVASFAAATRNWRRATRNPRRRTLGAPSSGHALERSPLMTTHYDVIIIGSGAGGGTLFHALAATGKRILLLERGGYVPREKANWSTRAVNVEG